MKITICGSLKFETEIQHWHEKLAMIGHTVYCMVVLPSQKWGDKDWYSNDEKETLDLLHLSKIEESDCIFVVDCGRYDESDLTYIGESTRKEIKWAVIRRKGVYKLSEQSDVQWLMDGVDCFKDHLK